MVTVFLRFQNGHATAVIEQKIIDNRYIMEKVQDLNKNDAVVELTRIPPFAVNQTHLTLAAGEDMKPEGLARLARYIQKRIDNCGKLVASQVITTETKTYLIYFMLTNFAKASSLVSFLSNLDEVEMLRGEDLPKEFFADRENEDA